MKHLGTLKNNISVSIHTNSKSRHHMTKPAGSHELACSTPNMENVQVLDSAPHHMTAKLE